MQMCPIIVSPEFQVLWFSRLLNLSWYRALWYVYLLPFLPFFLHTSSSFLPLSSVLAVVSLMAIPILLSRKSLSHGTNGVSHPAITSRIILYQLRAGVFRSCCNTQSIPTSTTAQTTSPIMHQSRYQSSIPTHSVLYEYRRNVCSAFFHYHFINALKNAEKESSS